jgi:hypothetical protein
LGFTFTFAPPSPLERLPEPLVDDVDWPVWALCVVFDEELMSVELWLAVTPLDTDWSPELTLTPGLTFAPRLTSELAMPTFAPTPTLGLTFTPVPELPPAAADSVEDDWLVEPPWFIVEDELMSVELWFALTLLDTDWSPLPTFTPGLMFAPALMSVLLMPTLASTPTFGFTLNVELELSCCANAGLNAAITAAAATLSTKFFRFMVSPFVNCP